MTSIIDAFPIIEDRVPIILLTPSFLLSIYFLIAIGYINCENVENTDQFTGQLWEHPQFQKLPPVGYYRLLERKENKHDIYNNCNNDEDVRNAARRNPGESSRTPT